MNEAAISDLKHHISQEISGFEVLKKKDDTLQRSIGRLMFFNRRYMDSFITTFYPKIFTPDKEYPHSSFFTILSHEYVHLFDQKREGWRFVLKYGLPQWLSLLGFLSIFGLLAKPMFAFAVCFLFALPWPSKWRRDYEMRGYTMNMLIEYYHNGYISKESKQSILSQFIGMNYYRMWWNADDIKLDMLKAEADVRSGSILIGEHNHPYAKVAEIMIRHKIKRV